MLDVGGSAVVCESVAKLSGSDEEAAETFGHVDVLDTLYSLSRIQASISGDTRKKEKCWLALMPWTSLQTHCRMDKRVVRRTNIHTCTSVATNDFIARLARRIAKQCLLTHA